MQPVSWWSLRKKMGDTLPIGVLADMGNLTWILKHTVPVSAIFFVPVGGPFILNPSSTYFWQSRASNALLHNSCLRSLWSTHWVDTKVALGFIGICRDLVCWTIVFVCFHGLVCFGVVFVVDRNTDDNTRKQPLSDASVKIDGSTSWRSACSVLLLLVILRIWLANAKRSLWRWWRNIFAERLSGCAEFHMVRLIEPLSLHVLPKLGKTWLVLLVDVFFTLFLKCFWAARSCSDVWLSFRSFGGTGTTDDNPWKQPRWNKQCGLEWFDYLIACASTSKRVKFSDICSVTLLLCVSVVQPPTEEIAQFLFALFVKHALSGYKVALGFIGICRDLVCWTIVFVCFHGLVCFGVVFVVDGNTGWQHKKATTVWCQCEDRWID